MAYNWCLGSFCWYGNLGLKVAWRCQGSTLQLSNSLPDAMITMPSLTPHARPPKLFTYSQTSCLPSFNLNALTLNPDGHRCPKNNKFISCNVFLQVLCLKYEKSHFVSFKINPTTFLIIQ